MASNTSDIGVSALKGLMGNFGSNLGFSKGDIFLATVVS